MKTVLIGAIHLYRWLISPLLGPRCRFYPSCSQYALQCLHHSPLKRAVPKITQRLLKCHPWHPGGVDLP